MSRQHRTHAAQATGKGGNSFDIGPTRWRGEGGDADEKREMAHRLVVCWNVMEGVPTEAILAGAVSGYHDAVDALVAEVERHLLDPGADSAIGPAIRRLREAMAAYRVDMTDGRPADCDGCYPPPKAKAKRKAKAATVEPLALHPEEDNPPCIDCGHGYDSHHSEGVHTGCYCDCVHYRTIAVEAP